jgi:hypothetical protein
MSINKLTVAGVRKELSALGLTLARTDAAGEFRVCPKGTPDLTNRIAVLS